MRNELEPGLLRVFRWYVGIRLALLFLVLVADRGESASEPRQYPIVGIVLFGALFLYLFLPRRRLGRAYLPFAIVLATIAPIADIGWNIAARIRDGYSPNAALSDYWVPFFLLFVPFILVAWQYRYRWVLVFAAGSTVLDMGIVSGILEPQGANLSVLGALLFARGALFAFLGLFISKLVARQREARAVLEAEAATVEKLAAGRERSRLARELHDTLAHSMTATAVQLEAAQATWDTNPEKSREMIDSALQRTRDGLVEARRAIEALRASPLEERGLRGALAWLADETSAVSGLEISVEGDRDEARVPPDVEQATFRIADEAITNAVRHAEATKVSVQLDIARTGLRLSIVDDGIGFDTGASHNGHHGLTGMRERADLVGGSIEIDSSSIGTTIGFTAPLGAA